MEEMIKDYIQWLEDQEHIEATGGKSPHTRLKPIQRDCTSAGIRIAREELQRRLTYSRIDPK